MKEIKERHPEIKSNLRIKEKAKEIIKIGTSRMLSVLINTVDLLLIFVHSI
jgi:hypothetical protein